MLKSMTAYGRASLKTKAGYFVFEIQSVNRKFLEINVFVPKELTLFDVEIKKWLVPYLTRGQITVKVTASFEGSLPFSIRPNLPLARQLKSAWNEIAEELEMPRNEFNLSLLSDVSELLKYQENVEEEESYREALKHVLENALKIFMQMKIQEGAVLQGDISARIKKIRLLLEAIEKKAPHATVKYRDKLLQRLNEFLPGYVENEERILREIALYAEKIDIAEEITRFLFHVNHLEELLDSTTPSVGKTLEFVLQELNREINTIGSKSSDTEIARAVIDIKSELERIREQIQNVE